MPLLERPVPFMENIVVSNKEVIKRLKSLNSAKAFGHDELHHRVLKQSMN